MPVCNTSDGLHTDLTYPASRNVRNKFLFLQATDLYFVIAVLRQWDIFINVYRTCQVPKKTFQPSNPCSQSCPDSLLPFFFFLKHSSVLSKNSNIRENMSGHTRNPNILEQYLASLINSQSLKFRFIPPLSVCCLSFCLNSYRYCAQFAINMDSMGEEYFQHFFRRKQNLLFLLKAHTTQGASFLLYLLFGELHSLKIIGVPGVISTQNLSQGSILKNK